MPRGYRNDGSKLGFYAGHQLNKGMKPANPFPKGHATWNKGKPLSKDHKRNIGLANSDPKIKIECRVCKTIFLVKSSRNKTAKYCSRKCGGIAIRGENHPKWRGGITKNREHHNKMTREWRKNNPLSVKISTLKRRLSMSDLTIETIQQVYENNINKYGTLTCYLSEQPIIFGKDHLEHKTPVSRGGDNKKENLDVACQRCNCRKWAKTVEEYKKENYKNGLKISK